jgi:hypothetical protein
MSEIAKTLAPKLKMIPELTDKFLLEQRGPLAGNTMLASDPSCGGTFAQKMWADAQQDNIGAQSALSGTAPASRDPLSDTGKPLTGQSQNQGVSALRTVRAVNRVRRIVNIGTGRRMTRHNHITVPFRTTCRKRCADKPRLFTR